MEMPPRPNVVQAGGECTDENYLVSVRAGAAAFFADELGDDEPGDVSSAANDGRCLEVFHVVGHQEMAAHSHQSYTHANAHRLLDAGVDGQGLVAGFHGQELGLELVVGAGRLLGQGRDGEDGEEDVCKGSSHEDNA